MVKHFVAENILLSVNPEVGESFLSGVQDFCQITEAAFLVKHLVGLGELLTVVPGCAICLEVLAKSLDLIQKPFAGSLTILRVKVVLLVCPLL